jgi:hypothetical protein
MRRAMVVGSLVLCALLARGEDLQVFAGGFAPHGAQFRVTFGFSDLAITNAKKPVEISAPGLASPTGEWSSAGGATAQLEICCVRHSVGLDDGTLAVARLRLTNPTARPFKTTLAVAIAPQGEIHALAFEKHAFFMEGRPVLVADTPSRGAILADSPFASRPLTPQDTAHVESVKGDCRGEMLYDLALAPGQTQTLGFICPVLRPNGAGPGLDFFRALSVEELFTQAQKDAVAR